MSVVMVTAQFYIDYEQIEDDKDDTIARAVYDLINDGADGICAYVSELSVGIKRVEQKESVTKKKVEFFVDMQNENDLQLSLEIRESVE